ncbi:hypothetical protein ARMSODRAFT_1019595 [Armillaria solidipes]|uniref:Uncharacterized protein n=1 Tax=Armillaria solidipes TaxID=1076256 RepID=A0A2H3BC55_9AGAR|nr:hypothetical protein ARMSODRAFT_1019595 [Armillaria solidipes]
MSSTRKGKKDCSAHWNSDKMVFQNPWMSWNGNRRMDVLTHPFLAQQSSLTQCQNYWHDEQKYRYAHQALLKAGTTDVPVKTLTWDTEEERNNKSKVTWLRHACFLIELSLIAPSGRGARVLFDSAFREILT